MEETAGRSSSNRSPQTHAKPSIFHAPPGACGRAEEGPEQGVVLTIREWRGRRLARGQEAAVADVTARPFP